MIPRNHFETFDHGADIGIRGIGSSPEEAFEHGAEAMFSLTIENFSEIRPVTTVKIQCESYDLPGLFTAWLNSLLAESDISGMIFCRFHVKINGPTLSGTASGEPFNPEIHTRGIEVKGATFTELKVEETEPGRWIAQCVVDV